MTQPPAGYALLVHYDFDRKFIEDPCIDVLSLDVNPYAEKAAALAEEAALQLLIAPDSPLDRLERAEVIRAGTPINLEAARAKRKESEEAAERVRAQRVPRRWRLGYHSGTYFPSTDLSVDSMGARNTGMPRDVEWLDPVDDLPGAKGRPT